jgi:hypothetical protein
VGWFGLACMNSSRGFGLGTAQLSNHCQVYLHMRAVGAKLPPIYMSQHERWECYFLYELDSVSPRVVEFHIICLNHPRLSASVCMLLEIFVYVYLVLNINSLIVLQCKPKHCVVTNLLVLSSNNEDTHTHRRITKHNRGFGMRKGNSIFSGLSVICCTPKTWHLTNYIGRPRQ